MNETKIPKISVIMPVYNAEKFLAEAIESISNQTFTDFELIIVNDGSKDNSLNIINDYKNKDSRIKLLDQENTGIVGALNNALKISSGKFIVRMDADDISEKERFEKQVIFLEKENAYLCGTWARIIDENGILLENKKMNYPKKTWLKNKFYLLRENPFIHPSVMFKREVYDLNKDKNGNLYKNYKHIEDYELWTRIVPKYKSINLQEYLLKYRVHSNQITKKFNFNMKLKGVKIRILALLRLIKAIF